MRFLSSLLFSLLLCFWCQVLVANTFIAKENGQIVAQSGNVKSAHSPYSTFKIPLALMGFDSKILQTPALPVVTFTAEIDQKYVTFYDPVKYPKMQMWKRDHTPETWMKYSVIWFSRHITHTLGMRQFFHYVTLLGYGNLDVLGDVSKDNDGLMNSWLGSSLDITPLQQVEFLEKLALKKLPLSVGAQDNTIAIMADGNVFDGWQLYGKTGGTMNEGWFVGWVEKAGRRIVFAQYVKQTDAEALQSNQSCGLVARTRALESLLPFVTADLPMPILFVK